MGSTFDEYLAAYHETHRIADELLDQALSDVSHQVVVSKQRIIVGEANEVYEVEFADGKRVIVRVSRNAIKTLDRESWAINACAKRGVPVPEVLALRRFAAAEGHIDVCIQRKIDGVILSKASAPPEVVREIVVQAGDYLSRMHAISTDGFGYIDAQGVGEFRNAGDEVAEFSGMGDEFGALALRVGLNTQDVERAMRLVVEDARSNAPAVACLNHNDFAAKHIIVNDGRLAGIIDWGEVSGGEPLSDVVRWDYGDGDRFPLAWLVEGYRDKKVFTASFADRVLRKRLAFSLWSMRWYDSRGYAEGVAKARAKFAEDLASLG